MQKLSKPEIRAKDIFVKLGLNLKIRLIRFALKLYTQKFKKEF